MAKENLSVHKPTPELPYMYVYPKPSECRLIARGDSNLYGCPLHHGSSCSHGLDDFVCEYGITHK